METFEIVSTLSRGEDSKNQFKRTIESKDSLAAELVAMSNSQGGKIFVGVEDNGTICGLSQESINRINQLLSSAASENIKPAINPQTQIAAIEGKNILIIDIPAGINKPYQDKNGSMWVKSGADKRKATSREEFQRLFQESGMLHADTTMPINEIPLDDLDLPYFRVFYEKRYEESLDEQTIPLKQLISNLNLGKEGKLNLAGALLFSKYPSAKLPAYIVKAIAFPGKEISEHTYLDSRNIEGKIADIFDKTVAFILNNTKQIQANQSVNSIGVPEIPKIVIEELVANAIIHRDYFISSSIRVFVFSDRVEIISPGHLPNNLTIENIKAGNSNTRNPTLASFANYIIPYRGMGTGIIRSLRAYNDIDFIDDRQGNLFKCIIKRRNL